jgi:hypothetical protein
MSWIRRSKGVGWSKVTVENDDDDDDDEVYYARRPSLEGTILYYIINAYKAPKNADDVDYARRH